jgi:hypothetical protein
VYVYNAPLTTQRNPPTLTAYTCQPCLPSVTLTADAENQQPLNKYRLISSHRTLRYIRLPSLQLTPSRRYFSILPSPSPEGDRSFSPRCKCRRRNSQSSNPHPDPANSHRIAHKSIPLALHLPRCALHCTALHCTVLAPDRLPRAKLTMQQKNGGWA